MLFGASLAGATDKQLADIQTIGTAVGIAFQMRDDILDRLPNDDGKTKFSDIYEGNQTIVRSLLQQHCTTEQRSAVSSYRKKLLTSSDQQYLSDIIKTHQIKQHVAKSIASYLDQAQVCVDQAEINQEYKQFFLDIMQKIRSI